MRVAIIIILLCSFCSSYHIFPRWDDSNITLSDYVSHKVCHYPLLDYISTKICASSSRLSGLSLKRKATFSFQHLEFPWGDPVYPVAWACCIRRKCDRNLLTEIICQDDKQ
ncbi:hypothetical protein QR680_000493 [Steinernema hermaphroditum]|uniref:Uncharacterized protein n=1 Tax=Steinernema hermaphroditum TaxID=289476 RepID=A0AA39LE99_9BILA|nr:hypothetical protein QR680_000493 [Steinernema hermaphroditum]